MLIVGVDVSVPMDLDPVLVLVIAIAVVGVVDIRLKRHRYQSLAIRAKEWMDLHHQTSNRFLQSSLFVGNRMIVAVNEFQAGLIPQNHLERGKGKVVHNPMGWSLAETIG